MYETNKSNLDNVLQKIRNNSLYLLLMLTILIIIIIVTIITDYVSFSKTKEEGFDIPGNIPSPPPNTVPGNAQLPPNTAPGNTQSPPNTVPVNTQSPPNTVPGNAPSLPSNFPIPPGLNTGSVNIPQLPGDIGNLLDKYKNYYNNIDKATALFNDFNKFKNLNIKDEINNVINNSKTDIKNEMLSIVNNQANTIKNGITNINLNSIPTIKDPKISNTIIIISFILIVIVLCFAFLPSLSHFKNLFNQMNNVTYVILYTIFIILFFRLLPTTIMDKNAYYIVPITIIISVFIFIIGFRTNYTSEFNVNYERIKMIILYFCFITMCITYYSTNPGEYITKNFNSSLPLVLLIGLFGFLYLIILLTLPDNYNIFSSSGSSNSSKNITNALTNISAFSKYGGIGFILFLVIMTTVIATYPGGFFKNVTTSTIVIVLTLIISIIWAILLIVNMFNGFNSNNPSGFMDSRLTFAKKTLLALLGLTLSGIIIGYIVYSVQNLSGRSNILSFVLSIFLIISILILIYKTIFVKLPSNNANKGKDSFFRLIINLIFYIPCLFSGIFDGIMKTLVSEYNSTTTGTILILIVTICLFILYIYLPKIQHNVNLQGGKQLVENPINTNTQQTLANYIQLNGSDKFDYQYSISFWLYIDSNAPNTNPSYNQYTSLLNYGGKPNILYKAKTNTLMVTMEQKNLDKESKNKLLEFDDNGNRIIYTNKNVLLQKWNNIIIQFNGGTLDIFLNGELVKSSIEVIPYMNYDTLTVGSDVGVNGGICNVVYYKNPLTITNIYYIYKNAKDENPPVIQNSNNTIIPLTK